MTGSHNHRVAYVDGNVYRISWTLSKGSGLSYPKVVSRFTNSNGARAFAKRWGLRVPKEAHHEQKGIDK